MQKLYTIQEVRDMILEMAEGMNQYKYLDAANGIWEVQKMLEARQELEKDS
jgi:hypothetical protein